MAGNPGPPRPFSPNSVELCPNFGQSRLSFGRPRPSFSSELADLGPILTDLGSMSVDFVANSLDISIIQGVPRGCGLGDSSTSILGIAHWPARDAQGSELDHIPPLRRRVWPRGTLGRSRPESSKFSQNWVAVGPTWSKSLIFGRVWPGTIRNWPPCNHIRPECSWVISEYGRSISGDAGAVSGQFPSNLGAKSGHSWGVFGAMLEQCWRSAREIVKRFQEDVGAVSEHCCSNVWALAEHFQSDFVHNSAYYRSSGVRSNPGAILEQSSSNLG